MEYPGSEDGSFSLYIALSDQTEDGLLFRALDREGQPVLEFVREDGSVRVDVYTLYQDRRVRFTLTAPAAKGSLLLEWHTARVALYADDALADEEWPLGELTHGEWTAEAAEGVPFYEYGECTPREETDNTPSGSMYFARPRGHNTGVGDCMPFADGDTLHLFYLIDRRGHQSKLGLGAHRWAHVSTKDGVHWQGHPVALEIDGQWEGSICTGSLIRVGDTVRAWYAVRMSDGSAARIMHADSADCVRFRKSGEYFTLPEPFDAKSARDPMVFFGPDGLYHMLVTTSFRGEGCLAHLTGGDCEHWQLQSEPFVVPGLRGQPECADWFEWNGRYYLVFGIAGDAMYCVSDEPFRGWSAPRTLCGSGISVAKTAPWQGGRMAAGFVRKDAYAGDLVLHMLRTEEDGTIRNAQWEEELEWTELADIALRQDCGRAERELLCENTFFRLKMELTPESGLCGVCGGSMWDMRIDSRTGILRLGDQVLCGYGAGQVIRLDIVCRHNLVDVIANGQCATLRCAEGLRCAPTLYALWGSCRAEGIRYACPE